MNRTKNTGVFLECIQHKCAGTSSPVIADRIKARMMTKFLSSAFLLLFIFGVSISDAQEHSKRQSISYPNRKIEEWSLGKANEEAESDIKNNTMKIYYSGTIAAAPAGVSPEDVHLINNLPIADGGIGCIISDRELRDRQSAYAKKYNEIIVQHIKGPKTSP